jgi:hypothetical protein
MTTTTDRRSFRFNISDQWSVVKCKNDRRSFFLLFHPKIVKKNFKLLIKVGRIFLDGNKKNGDN